MYSFRLLVAALCGVLLTGWGGRHSDPPWPHTGPMPDDPVQVRPHRYEPVTKGNLSYRPTDPMPWGDVNKRVAPQGALPPPAFAAPQATEPAYPVPPGLAPKIAPPGPSISGNPKRGVSKP